MRPLFRTSFDKTITIILLIMAVVLLCPVNRVLAYAPEDSCEARTSMLSSHNINPETSDCSKTHSVMENHTINVLPAFNYLATLFFVATVFLVIFYRKLLLALARCYLAKLKYYRHRYRIFIKPKLEKFFLRWLNLLGNSVALSI